MLEKSVGEHCCREVLEKFFFPHAVRAMTAVSRDVLEKSVGEKFFREVLGKSVVEKCWRKVL